MRLDKATALAGLTRSEAKKAVAAGRVCVDGAPLRDPAAQVAPESVTVDGRPVAAPHRGQASALRVRPAARVPAPPGPWPRGAAGPGRDGPGADDHRRPAGPPADLPPVEG